MRVMHHVRTEIMDQGTTFAAPIQRIVPNGPSRALKLTAENDRLRGRL